VAGRAHSLSWGILKPETAFTRFRIERLPPSPALAPLVTHYWFIDWDLRGEEPHEQRVLPGPQVNMTFMAGRCRIAGVIRGVYTERLHGAGRVLGVLFRPGGFHPFLGASLSTVTDRFLAVDDVFGAAGSDLCRDVLGAPDGPGMAAAVDRFLSARSVRADSAVAEVATAVERVEADPSVTRVAQLARDLGTGTRRLQRLFAEYVGVGPKWVIQRYRLREAAERAAQGYDVDWAHLALDLGYHDQAHFIREFTAMIGTSPSRYARECTAPPA
jgi:AraC-like DNA-binding protein